MAHNDSEYAEAEELLFSDQVAADACCLWRETYFPIKDHLVSFPVFDLVVEVLRQLQALVYLSLKSDSSLSEERLS